MTTATLPAQQQVKTSDRLFSEEVAIAEANSPAPQPIAYQFTNGRKFLPPTNPYA